MTAQPMVYQIYKQLRAEFPNATVQASTWDEFGTRSAACGAVLWFPLHLQYSLRLPFVTLCLFDFTILSSAPSQYVAVHFTAGITRDR